MEALSTYAGVCVIRYEPVDDYGLAPNSGPQKRAEMVAYLDAG